MGSSVKETVNSRFEAKIKDWKGKLVDLSRRNKLLFFTPSRSSSLQIKEPSLIEIFNRLVIDEGSWKFFIPPQEEKTASSITLRKPEELLCTARESIPNVLMNMYRRSRSDFEERGVRILYVTFGMVNWREKEQSDECASPLILLPVELRRKSAAEPFELLPVEGDAILNPALRVRLSNDFNIELPESEDWENEGIGDYFERVNSSVLKQQGWTLLPDCWISLFSFYKLPIYEDLNKNEKKIKLHPVVLTLAGEEVKDIANENLVDAKTLDASVNPRQNYLILDADSSQLACIETIKKGTNLIIQGPPGTGKSQTIVNLIAEFVSRGKKVLFVSEKIAALEVVYKRLQDRGLGYFCLELHSHKTNKRQVIEELHRCYLEELQPKKTMSETEFRQLEDRRKLLNEYVEALHRIQEPLQLNVYQVLGKLAGLKHVTFVSPGSVDSASLGPDQINLVARFASRLEQVWSIVIEGKGFPWRGCKITSYGMGIRSEFQKNITTCLETMEEVRKSGTNFASILELTSPTLIADIDWLLKTLEFLRRCPEIPSGLLTRRDLDPYEYLQSVELDASRWPFVRIAREYDRKIIEGFDLEKLIRVHSSPFRWLSFTYYKSRKQIKTIRHDHKLPKSILEDLKCVQQLKQIIDWTISFNKHLGDYPQTKKLLEIVEMGASAAPDLAPLKQKTEVFKKSLTELESQFEPGYPQFDGFFYVIYL